MKRELFFTLGFLLTACISFSALADPPERVARLNFIQGDVTFRPAGLDDWTDATVNRPLIADDELWTDLASKAELHLGSSAIRLGELTSFSFLALDDHLAQIHLRQGTIDIRIQRLGEEDTFEIDAPNVSLSALRPGSYRISVSANGERTEVTLRSGEMEGISEGTSFIVHPHESMTVDGYGGDQTRQIADLPPPDGFDRWCRDRDLRDDRAAASAHVPREVIGYEDLGDFGVWENSPAYGWVWAPRAVVVGWAPYRFGHWAWIEPWGWTWVDDAPWGFAPFHYGRWAAVNGRWLWVPGAVVHPVYAPALVAFAGGGRWSASISFGGGAGVAWFPLAPGEVYVPSYRVRPAYVRAINVNVTNINVTNINVTNIHYANQNVAGAVTAVSRDDFTRARPVAQAAVVVNVKTAASFQVAGSTAPIAPQQASVIGRSVSMPARIAHPPLAVFDRPVVAKTIPPPAPVPFAARQQVLDQHPGRALDAAEVQNLRPMVVSQPKAVIRPALRTGFVPPKAAVTTTASPAAKPGPAVVSPATTNTIGGINKPTESTNTIGGFNKTTTSSNTTTSNINKPATETTGFVPKVPRHETPVFVPPKPQPVTGTQPPTVNGAVTTNSKPVVAPQPMSTNEVKTVNQPPRRPVVNQELKKEPPKEELKKDQPKKEQPKKDDSKKDDKKKDDKKNEPKKD
ncbi:MAG TPA: DUF6600 domain-containing protein [Thermoanaerobaculia bacterium]|nr:DUF6600 domain-containing protein [Thermoanaerobaculia bacterium]